MRRVVLKIVAKTRTEIEASLVMGRLDEASIPCMRKGGSGRDSVELSVGIYVEETDLDRARATLKAGEGDFDESELARLSEEAGAKWAAPEPAEQNAAAPPGKPPADSAKQGFLHGALKKLAKRAEGGGRKPNPFGD